MITLIRPNSFLVANNKVIRVLVSKTRATLVPRGESKDAQKYPARSVVRSRDIQDAITRRDWNAFDDVYQTLQDF